MAEFTAQQRRDLAKEGAAMPDGSYPIRNRQDLKNAIQAYGRSPDAETKAHIVKRARALGMTDLLPEGWDTNKQMNAKIRGGANRGRTLS